MTWSSVSERDRLNLVVLGHFFPFYPPQNPKYRNFEKHGKIIGLEISSFYTSVSKIAIIWCTVLDIQSKTKRVLSHFLPFLPPIDPKIRTYKRMKNIPGHIIFLHVCTVNGDHMIYGSWNTYKVWQTEFFVIIAIFFPFHPLAAQKIKNLKN